MKKYKLDEDKLDYAKVLNLQLPHDILDLAKLFPKHHKEWSKIDRQKDKSLSAKEFRFWLYLRLLDEKYPII